MKKTLTEAADSLLSLLYPNLCTACAQRPALPREWICTTCRAKLPYTNYHLLPENPFMERFWGRIPLVSGAAMFHFRKGGRVQRLVHSLKYRGKQELGRELGRWYGIQLRQSTLFSSVELVLPVPLHPRKQRIRGYNQSALLAEGVAESLGCTWGDLMQRQKDNESQTRRTRMERVENVEEAFFVPQPTCLENLHVLLIDDVLTTGATLEACAIPLLRIQGLRLSMAAIACADL